MISRTRMTFLIFAALTATLPSTTRTNAQNHTRVPEPPIPVYFEYSNRTDSLRAAQEGSILTNGSSLSFILRRYDSLQAQVEKSTAQGTAHFIWLYSLIAALGAVNIVLLFFVSRLRKELSEVKRLEHHRALIESQAQGNRPARDRGKSSVKSILRGSRKKQT
jgi:hypothetical protein